ncbi:hypothetical protein GOBAR_AA01008 [Gossypium barbadense]|uniref:Uncharacterized protein n=1 Tax=Gossypium barbadense TaxID=3634 RepID=A0A2P5YVB9_GOSBA|nr:hypothetical protein GOBAR_AA01008 [Gossypium barbadense]
MKLIDDEDMETMVTLYCRNWSRQTDLIQLFAELADVKPAEDFTPLSEELEVQDPVRATIRGIDINLNAPPASENLNLVPHLQIHPVVIETDTDGDDEYDNNDPSGQEVEDFSDPDINKVPNDIDDEGANGDGNVNVSLVGNPN